MMKRVVVFLLIVALIVEGATDKDKARTKPLKRRRHEFFHRDHVPVYVNNVGPYHNPTELYMYNKLPFCPIEHPTRKPTTLAERLGGDRPILADIYNISFGDDLPIHGFIGYTEPAEPRPESIETRHFLFTHFDFSISRNDRRIIQINVTTDRSRVVELTDMAQVEFDFTYSVRWINTTFPFKRRMDLYKDTFFTQEMEIHWLSIMNSIVLVVLLTGFLAIIVMRVVKNDFVRYERGDEAEEGSSGGGGGDPDDYGWKLIHGDVFRFPPARTLFCALNGVGAQIVAVVAGLLLLSILGVFHPEMGGTIYVAAFVLYALTSCVGGFVASRLYRQFGGERWAWPVVLVATLFPIPFLAVFIFVDIIAVSYGSTTAQRFTTVLQVLSINVLVGLPLTVLGGIIGRRTAGNFDAPCRTKNAVREIPSIPWYRTTPFQMIIAGFLPFSAIYIELFYIYASIWGHSYYSLYGILSVVFVILLLVTACITVALTYFQLSMEDHRWWWNSFLCGSSTGLFVFAYSCFYYIYRTKMSGLLQGAFYFGYTAVGCYLMALMLGSIGFSSSLIFVRFLFSAIKID